jgi:hypothetical protein|tara:strand:+ start:775 stop:960 length:186 start_codon:yes stop_codon:yes gene_type:complete
MNRDYKEKIVYHMNKLDEALTTANTRNIQKSLDSITYFTNKQLDIVGCSLDLDYEMQYQSE